MNAPFGITLAHNGNLTNWEQLKIEMFKNDRRHINTAFRHRSAGQRAFCARVAASQPRPVTRWDPDAVFKAVADRCTSSVRGSYAVVAQIAGDGLLAFRDPYGIRPMCLEASTKPSKGVRNT